MVKKIKKPKGRASSALHIAFSDCAREANKIISQYFLENYINSREQLGFHHLAAIETVIHASQLNLLKHSQQQEFAGQFLCLMLEKLNQYLHEGLDALVYPQVKAFYEQQLQRLLDTSDAMSYNFDTEILFNLDLFDFNSIIYNIKPEIRYGTVNDYKILVQQVLKRSSEVIYKRRQKFRRAIIEISRITELPADTPPQEPSRSLSHRPRHSRFRASRLKKSRPTSTSPAQQPTPAPTPTPTPTAAPAAAPKPIPTPKPQSVPCSAPTTISVVSLDAPDTTIIPPSEHSTRRLVPEAAAGVVHTQASIRERTQEEFDFRMQIYESYFQLYESSEYLISTFNIFIDLKAQDQLSEAWFNLELAKFTTFASSFYELGAQLLQYSELDQQIAANQDIQTLESDIEQVKQELTEIIIQIHSQINTIKPVDKEQAQANSNSDSVDHSINPLAEADFTPVFTPVLTPGTTPELDASVTAELQSAQDTPYPKNSRGWRRYIKSNSPLNDRDCGKFYKLLGFNTKTRSSGTGHKDVTNEDIRLAYSFQSARKGKIRLLDICTQLVPRLGEAKIIEALKKFQGLS